MNSSWSRRTTWSYRGLKQKIQNLPQQICKACLRQTVKLCDSDGTRVCVLLLLLCFLCIILFLWIHLRDPCFKWSIRRQICDDYSQGLLAGRLCYDLCVDRQPIMYSCVDEMDTQVTFQWENNIVKVTDLLAGQINTRTLHSVWEGMSKADFIHILEGFVAKHLGDTDHSSLIERMVNFADFNTDGKLTYGEVRSLWQLLNIPEFFTLFLFQTNDVFPHLNGTCGPLYAYESTYHQTLYDKSSKSVLAYIFPNSFRWTFPEFPRRMHIALGLLEYASLVLEEENTRFYMCDFSPTNFGYTEYYQLKVSNIVGIVSETQLNQKLFGQRCGHANDCVYGRLCGTSCDSQTNTCMAISEDHSPDMIRICEILIDYILYDTPSDFKQTLAELIAECRRMGQESFTPGLQVRQVKHNIVLERLKELLWDRLKNEDNYWLYKQTDQPFG